ncbi:hypothetical protein GCM10007895_34530 [Paraferrimonas sedimenticola]|uniref:Uncharacterized protein n=1 Tax=Paraferrimonas sedimenticola TaxID=375674 RepID=A0AA37RZL3_9GAMM|nr:hypothetical protein GCM10007895_34530 [Paraferrimonas sedimenticola]
MIPGVSFNIAKEGEAEPKAPIVIIIGKLDKLLSDESVLVA